MKAKHAGLALATLKAGQQVAGDLTKTFAKKSIPGFLTYGAQHLFRVSSAGLAGYAIDEGISYAEEYIPKPIRGISPILLATIGVGAITNYFGHHFGLEEGLGTLQATEQIIKNYQTSLQNIIAWNPTEINAGYLTGGVVCLKAGFRLAKNLGEHLAHTGKKKRLEYKKRKAQEIENLKTEIDHQKENNKSNNQ